MKYIIKRKNFLLEKISWLDNRSSDWDQEFYKLIMSFHDKIIDLIDELKDKFNDKDDPIEVHKVYLEYLEKSLDSLIENVRLVKDDNNLEKLWTEFILNLSMWKESFKKMSEKMDNYNSVFKLGYEIFSMFNRYFTRNKPNTYYDHLKGELDDQRENIIKFIEEIKEDLKLRMVDIDAEQVFDMSNLDKKETDELNLNPGDEVRYYKNNDEENIAIISHNQDELKEKDNIRLVSKQSGEQFDIDKSDIIEIIPKHKTLNQEVSDKLKHIKKDPEKLDKLNDYLTDLEKTEEKLKDGYFMNEDNSLQQKLFDDDGRELLKITNNQAKIWLSDETFKQKHVKKINKMLRDVYKPLGYWKKYQLWGVMDLPWEVEDKSGNLFADKKWSLLNKINTNFGCLAIMVNEINRALVEGNSKIPLFDFRNKKFGTKEFYDEYDRMMEFVDKNKEKIFLKLTEEGGSKIINKMVNRIKASTRVGNKAEGLVSRYIKYIFPGAKRIEIPKGDGERQDMIDGSDITFYLNGSKKTVQVKRSKGIFKENNRYRIVGLSIAKHYDVDYIACVTKYYMYFFEYDQNNIEKLTNGDIIIDKSVLVRSFKLKTR